MGLDPRYREYLAVYERFTPEQLLSGDPDFADSLAPFSVAPAGYHSPQVRRVTDVSVPGPHGDVRVRVYQHKRGPRRGPAVVWCHGGGWVSGDLEMPEADLVAREVCSRAGATVFSVDYRLAVGGVRYPIPLDDVVTAYRWAAANAVSFDADQARVLLGGASAGGNLAAGAALRLRDEHGPVPSGVVLAYPVVHAVLPPPSEELHRRLATLPALLSAPQVVAAMAGNYLGGPAESASPYAMPGLADLACYPRTLIINCEYDVLRASGEAYARALANAGVPVQAYVESGVLHGHLNMPWLDGAQRSLGKVVEWISAT